MSMEMMKKAMMATVGAAALTGAINAHATTIESADADQTATFSGQSTLTQSGQSISCNLSLNGNVTQVGNDIEIEVTSGSATGGIFSGCGAVQLDFNPAWTAVVLEADLPSGDEQVAGEFDNVSVGTSLFGPCLNSNNNNAQNVPALFSNGAGTTSSTPNTAESEFDFATTVGDECSVNGTLTVDLSDDIDVFEP